MNGVNSVPTDEKGYVLHLGLKKGDLANRVVVVGSDSCACRLWSHLEDPENCFTKKSDRGFITYTGTFGGVAVSVCATGMGAPMMDFFVREARSVVDGPVRITPLRTRCLLAALNQFSMLLPKQSHSLSASHELVRTKSIAQT